jgi:hypothetical protein
VSALGVDHTPPLGQTLLRGIPFDLGTDQGRCLVVLGGSAQIEPLVVHVDRKARSVLFAHRQIDSEVLEGGPIGEAIADYEFHFGDGSTLRTVVRERFEIGVPGQLPALALSDVRHALPPRYVGEFARAGGRQAEVTIPRPTTYFLWAWINPRPDDVLRDLYVVPRGPRFAIAGITLGHVGEDPLVLGSPRLVKVELTDTSRAERDFDLAVEVDRGVAGFPYALPRHSGGAFIGDAMAGFGEAANRTSSPAYVEIAAIPSATVGVVQGGETLARVSWRELNQRDTVATGPVRLTVIDSGRNWVRTRILDDQTGRSIPCRVHFRTVEGVPFQPYGHHAHVNGNLSSWHVDVGGDVRLGQITYAYVDGVCEGWLPRGQVVVDVARGYEYAPLRSEFTIAPGQRDLTIRLRRLRDMNAERWFSGDTHVHFLSTQGAELEAQGEDLNVVNLLLSQWGHLFTNVEDFVGRPVVTSDGRTIVYASQENRQHFLGHLGLLGLKKPVMPWCSDGATEAELGGTLETTLASWADECHAQGGTVVLAHLPRPNGEPASLIATGRADAVEMIDFRTYAHREYYRYLNSGYRLPLVGGTDRMSNDVPVGLYRTYVRVPPEEAFDYESWCRNLRLGRTFVSAGPLLSLTVDGHDIGDMLQLPAKGGEVEIEARAESIFPMHSLQIIERGRVVASTDEPRGAHKLRTHLHLRVTGHTWVAARAGGPGYEQPTPHHDERKRGIFAHTSPVYVACGADWTMFEPATGQYMLTLIDMSLAYLRGMTTHFPAEGVTHRHPDPDHQAHLERPFLEAAAVMRRRMDATSRDGRRSHSEDRKP